jgi:hypothetical protein
MNKRLLSLAVAGAMVLGLAGMASAGIPDETNSTASSAGGVVLITPASTGGSIADAGATITVTVLDASSAPVANYPFQDIYVDEAVGSPTSVVLCQGGSVADADTDNSGVTTISGIIGGGGQCTETQVYINGTPLAGPNLTLGFNSPDIVPNLVVELPDFSAFGLDFGSTAFRSDLVYDGSVDIADFSAFGLTFGQTCP